MEKLIRLGVHDFVDLLLRKGDLDNRIFNAVSMQEGTRLHAWYQSKQGAEYEAEVYLEHTFKCGNFSLDMDGRADGVIVHGQGEDADYTVDEIKTTNADIDAFYEAQKEWHLGQGQMYAYMIMLDKGLPSIKVQLTYISQTDNTNIKQYVFIYSAADLSAIVQKYLEDYVRYLQMMAEMKEARQDSIAGLTFPFPGLRKGQQEMMDFAYETVRTSQMGFCEAKTGIGKTISALYPYIKCLYSENLEKIFYLTSKNSIKEVAYETLKRLEEEGSKLKGVILTSKETICLNSEKRHCNPDECPYAKNYYDKISQVISAALKEQNLFKEDDFIRLAEDNQICPFEMQLDFLNYADVIVGDYNYLFDPTARLMRFFENYEENPFLLLIDEAHNLPDRVRDMFSSEISLEETMYVIRSFEREKKHIKAEKEVVESLVKIVNFLQNIRYAESGSGDPSIMEEAGIPDALTDNLNGFALKGKKYLKAKKKINDAFLDFYYLVEAFLNLPEKDEKFAYYYEFDPKGLSVLSFHVSCLDPRFLIRQGYRAFKAGICFSATLSPRKYFIDLLGGGEDSLTLYLPSPFKRENCLVMTDEAISVKYRDRDYSIGKISDAIIKAISGRTGNYFIFFPSFEYLNKFRPLFEPIEEIDCYFQSSQMKEEERSAFLSHFKTCPRRTTLGFLVLGGIFAEGIDLIDDRLIGAIIVSVGLPKISYLSGRIQKYFGQDDPQAGFLYAYTYPGINRLFQAAGRVIRGENDRGVILYIDSRFANSVYKANLSDMYGSYQKCLTPVSIEKAVAEFWEKKEK